MTGVQTCALPIFGKMLASPLAMTAEGAQRAKEEFEQLNADKTTEKYKNIGNRLEAAGFKVDKNNLTLADYKMFLAQRNKDAAAAMGEAVEVLTGAAKGQYSHAELKDLKPEVVQQLETLADLENKDMAKEAEKLGMTKEQYQQTVKGKGTDPSKDRKSTRLNSSHIPLSRMPSSA